jgi:hypothetical protein
MTSRSELSELPHVSEVFIASRRKMHSPTRRAMSGITALYGLPESLAISY